MRLIGALTVVVAHSYSLVNGKPHYDFFHRLNGGYSAASSFLDMFFVISGYLITQSFFRHSTFKEFFIARVMRIVPAFAASIFIAVFFVGSFFTSLSFKEYFSSALTWRYFINISFFKLQFILPGVFNENFYHSNAINGSVWSLAYEWVLYGCLFLFAKIGFMKATKLNICIHAAIISASIYLNLYPEMTTITAFGIQSSKLVHFYPYFMIGSWLFILKEKFTLKWWHSLFVAVIWIFTFNTIWFSIWIYLAIPILTLWFAFLPVKFFKKVTATGDYSYGIYIFSFLIQQVIIHFTKNEIGIYPMILLSLFCSYLIAVLSFHCIENPALRWKKKSQ